jgi:hypothetical protein
VAQNMNARTRFEKSDGSLHREQEVPARAAKQGGVGKRILLILISAMVLSFLVWIPVEIWARHEAARSASTQLSETEAPATPAR